MSDLERALQDLDGQIHEKNERARKDSGRRINLIAVGHFANYTELFKSRRVLESAMEGDKRILLGARKSAETDDPGAADLHPITRACMGFHLWSLAGLGQQGDRMEVAVPAARIAASEG